MRPITVVSQTADWQPRSLNGRFQSRLISVTKLVNLPAFEDYFSDDQIIRQLCRLRIKEAEKRNDRDYAAQFTGTRANPERNQIDRMLPPRKKWSHFRPKFRRPEQDVNSSSLYRATIKLRELNPKPNWAIELDRYIVEVRSRVFGEGAVQLESPTVQGVAKDKGSKDHRALCMFPPQDNIIAGLTAKYFRELLDPLFEDSSFAFRTKRPEKPVPTHHDAFEEIFRIRTRSVPGKRLYVAECDIRGFFDSVDHEVAKLHLDRLTQRAGPIHPRAKQVFNAFLACYSFPQNVLQVALPELQKRNSAARIPWPEEALQKFHREPAQKRIGVPQGGAISCVIANIVLDYADKRIKAEAQKLGAQIHYLRYCDDMVLISPNKRHCQTVFSAYLKALDELKLPFHKPERVEQYGKAFWDSKSKKPYCWTGEKGPGNVPWLGFVGYQVRYDGLVRIKQKSVKKQLAKLVETTGEVRAKLMRPDRNLPPNQQPALLATKQEVLSSFRRKLASMGVGRINPNKPPDKPMPKCWASGYRALDNKPLLKTFLKQFDRERERQIRRLGRANIQYGQGKGKGGRKLPAAKGNAFSYHAQFQDAGGEQLRRPTA